MTLPTRALDRSGLEITVLGSDSWVMGGGNTDGQAPLVEGGYLGLAINPVGFQAKVHLPQLAAASLPRTSSVLGCSNLDPRLNECNRDHSGARLQLCR